MDYVPPWERLSNALVRVMAEAGLPRDQAQTNICRAIADGAVNIQGKLGRHPTTGFRASNTVLERKDFHIEPEIKPEDLDWEQSRPLKSWNVRREAFKKPGYWDLEWIELCVADVTKFLCPAGQASGQTPTTSRSQPAVENQEMAAGPAASSTAGPPKPGAAAPARRRGARPLKLEKARDAMRNDIQRGRLTPAQLDNMLEKNLATNYGVSRDTARKARKAVLSELNSRQIPTNDK